MDPRLEKPVLDPVESLVHGLTMAIDHPLVTLEQRFEGDGLRGGKDKVDAGPVPMKTVAYRAQTNACAGHMPLKEGTEGLGIHRPRKAQCLCCPAVPPACQTVPGIIF